MTYSELKVDAREAQYARLAGAILATLQEAVETRVNQGSSKTAIASRIGMHKSSLSRVLAGRVSNLTVRTISDILWASDFEPREFEASSYEDISSNYPCRLQEKEEIVNAVTVMQISGWQSPKQKGLGPTNWVKHVQS